MMENLKYITLNDKMKMPTIGFGTWKISNVEAPQIVGEALNSGYRMIDTATVYENEEGVGIAIKESALTRAEIFLSTKIWSSCHGYDSSLRAMDVSLKKLQTDYIDLYLIHWPNPTLDKYIPTWKALARLHKEGLAKSIGVCNFHIPHLQRLLDETGIVPAVNQIELHPYFQQNELREFHIKHGIVTESWSPLARGEIFSDPIIVMLAQKYKKTAAQIILRWHFENGLIAIPKSVKTNRILENLDIFDFHLNGEDLTLMTTVDKKNGRTGPNPETAGF